MTECQIGFQVFCLFSPRENVHTSSHWAFKVAGKHTVNVRKKRSRIILVSFLFSGGGVTRENQKQQQQQKEEEGASGDWFWCQCVLWLQSPGSRTIGAIVFPPFFSFLTFFFFFSPTELKCRKTCVRASFA